MPDTCQTSAYKCPPRRRRRRWTVSNLPLPHSAPGNLPRIRNRYQNRRGTESVTVTDSVRGTEAKTLTDSAQNPYRFGTKTLTVLVRGKEQTIEHTNNKPINM